MTRTIRDRGNTRARDGNIWRGCGEKNCQYCSETRQNIKLKTISTLKDLEVI